MLHWAGIPETIVDLHHLFPRQFAIVDGIVGMEGNGPIQRFLAETARCHSLWLVGGSLPLYANDAAKLRNTCLVFDPEGGVAGRRQPSDA